MSLQLMSAVWNTAPCDGTDLLLLLALADNANEQGICWPSVATLARKIRRQERQVYDHLRRLEEAGTIRRETRKGKSTIYHILTPAENRTPADFRTPADGRTPTPADFRTPTPADFRTQNRNMNRNINHHSFASKTANAVPPRDREKKPRAPDPLWDAAIASGLPAPTTDTERGRWNTALKKLRKINATPDDLTARIREYRRRWPNIECTITGVEGNWTPLGGQNAAHTTHKPDSPADRERAEAEHKKQMEANREFQRALAAEMASRGIRPETV